MQQRKTRNRRLHFSGRKKRVHTLTPPLNRGGQSRWGGKGERFPPSIIRERGQGNLATKALFSKQWGKISVLIFRRGKFKRASASSFSGAEEGETGRSNKVAAVSRMNGRGDHYARYDGKAGGACRFLYIEEGRGRKEKRRSEGSDQGNNKRLSSGKEREKMGRMTIFYPTWKREKERGKCRFGGLRESNFFGGEKGRRIDGVGEEPDSANPPGRFEGVLPEGGERAILFEKKKWGESQEHRQERACRTCRNRKRRGGKDGSYPKERKKKKGREDCPDRSGSGKEDTIFYSGEGRGKGGEGRIHIAAGEERGGEGIRLNTGPYGESGALCYPGGGKKVEKTHGFQATQKRGKRGEGISFGTQSTERALSSHKNEEKGKGGFLGGGLLGKGPPSTPILPKTS